MGSYFDDIVRLLARVWDIFAGSKQFVTTRKLDFTEV